MSPTGYTADVGDGKLTDFPAFALRCARAFGALITMRDDPTDAPIPDTFAPSSYHATALATARERLARLVEMTPEEADAESRAEHEREVARWNEHHAEVIATRGRYQAMLSKVLAWRPPTPEHTELRKFMVDQITESIRFDCNDWPRPAPTSSASGIAWMGEQRRMAQRDIEYHAKEHDAEVARVAGRTEWVRALRASLASPVSP